jgi:hypothetical protein
MYHATVLENPQKLREAAADLRKQVDNLITEFESRQIHFDELKKQYEDIHQPRAVALTKEMVSYAPHRIPDDLPYDSPHVPDVVTMKPSLTPETALRDLQKISRALGELLENVRV